MFSLLKDFLDEVKSFSKGKGPDVLLPPLVFVVVNQWWGLYEGVFGAFLVGLTIMVTRFLQKKGLLYAFGGLAGVVLALIFVVVSGNANSFYLPKMLSSGGLLLLGLLSLLIRRPLAMLASHLSRGWPMAWYQRPDVAPAYWEVTYFWMAYFLLRLVILWGLLLEGNLWNLTWVNILLGTPATLLILGTSYVYGMIRLRTLKGPGVDEFLQEKAPPWLGQKKGF